jgi:hypothetical protein
MAEFLYKVEGIYETDKGSGKDYTNFSFDIKLSRFYPEGAGSHILRRFLPILIRKQKNKPLLSGIRSWLITDVQKVNDDFPLVGKEISEMNEQEIQELACMYDIFEIPLPNTMSITELREKAMLAYMKKVLKIPMKTPEEQAKLDFFKRQPDGTLKLDLGKEKLVVTVVDNYLGKKQVVKKKSLSDFIKNAGQTVANGILAMTGNIDEGQDDSQHETGNDETNDGYPSLDDLQNPQNAQ